MPHDYETFLFANSSCPPLVGFDWGDNDSTVKDCRRRIADILTLIEKLPKVDKLVLTTRAPVYFHGEVEQPVTEATVLNSLQQTVNPVPE